VSSQDWLGWLVWDGPSNVLEVSAPSAVPMGASSNTVARIVNKLERVISIFLPRLGPAKRATGTRRSTIPPEVEKRADGHGTDYNLSTPGRAFYSRPSIGILRDLFRPKGSEKLAGKIQSTVAT
jgi:hypothetical protein